MPTSLCSGQISRRIADRLNERDATQGKVTRFVALPHTEGCGVSAGSAETIYSRTVLGHLASPSVRFGLLLEHGCEKTHNDYFRNRLREAGLDPARFGWASVQLDGGIESVVAKVEGWFDEVLQDAETLEYESVGPEALRLGLYASGPVSDEAALSLAEVTLAVVDSGGTVVVPERAAVLSSPAYLGARARRSSGGEYPRLRAGRDEIGACTSWRRRRTTGSRRRRGSGRRASRSCSRTSWDVPCRRTV